MNSADQEAQSRRFSVGGTAAAELPGVSYVSALAMEGFTGEVDFSYATREVTAFDNSIYRVRPCGVIFPRTVEDIGAAARALARTPSGPSLTARGGGTGTNGQSLSDGVILDCSRHLTKIVDFDPLTGSVVVEPGVVLDQLNAFLAPHGWFFPPSVSTASRATIGGMVATDASGRGSRHYGRTSDWIEELEIFLADGSAFKVSRLPPKELQPAPGENTARGRIYREVRKVLHGTRSSVDHVFPRINRGLTGYNLKDALADDGEVDLCKLLAGSEGTLALTGRMSLRLKRRPEHRGLVILAYDDFTRALEHVQDLIGADPLAIETLDDRILALARQDVLWTKLSGFLGHMDTEVQAVNFIDLAGETAEEVAAGFERVRNVVAQERVATVILEVLDPNAISAAWSLRAKSVGLLGAVSNERSGTAFVEDAAVPPELLPEFAKKFRAILDRHGLTYGMFGHADVGCLHVRPALDMTDPADRALIRTISDEIALLAKAFGGLLWGEHGRGFRGEYSPLFFGPELMPTLHQLKAIFDPGNRLNPGKLAVPPTNESHIIRIDEAPFRGALDETIESRKRSAFDRAVACNGNGACHSWDPKESMCPSYKVSRDKTQSPNGRAALFRAWARDPSDVHANALVESLNTCLSCRACASACPVKVDVPTMKSRFLAEYYGKWPRSNRDHLLRIMEALLLTSRHIPRLANAALHNPVTRRILEGIGLIQLPTLEPVSLERALASRGVGIATRKHLEGLSSAERERVVILAADTFLGTFDIRPVLAASELVAELGNIPLVALPFANGKALEVRGYEAAYSKVRRDIHRRLEAIREWGAPVVFIEPAVLEQFRRDGEKDLLSLDQFLKQCDFSQVEVKQGAGTPRLALHCTERSADPQTGERWVEIFRRFGLPLKVLEVGCCGMSGLFGHEKENVGMSRELFDLSWSSIAGDTLLATGFSCRAQVYRFGGSRPLHPVEFLATFKRAATRR